MSSLPVSPGGPTAIDDDTAALQLQQFLDEWCYRILNSSLAKSWDHKSAMGAMLDVFRILGFPMEDRDAILSLDEDSMINQLVQCMPMGIRDQFEIVALQLQSVVHIAARVRKVTEGDDAAVQEVFEETDGNAVFQQILKAAVVQSAKEVTRLHKVHNSWKKSTETRLTRLLRASEEAEHAQQQLLAIESQLEDFGVSQKKKSKQMLTNMAAGQEKTLLKSVFSSWNGYLLKVKAEKEIRDTFEKQIADLEKKYFAYKAGNVQNLRGVLIRASMEEDKALVCDAFKIWSEEVSARHLDAEGKAKLKMVEDQLAKFEESQKANAKRVMSRMAQGSTNAMLTLCIQSWVSFVEEYKRDKEINDEVKRKELELQAHLQAKKDETKNVLNRMLGASETGLITLMMQHWTQYLKDAKEAASMDAKLQEADAKFKSLKMRQGANARGVQGRVNEQINLNIQMRVFGHWILETKANRINAIFNSKLDSKRRQLQSVQALFKSFAMQLEQNLGGEDDSSARTFTGRMSTGRGKIKQRGLAKNGDGTVSLPDIHQRPAVA